MFPLSRAPFWYRIFEPQPYKPSEPKRREGIGFWGPNHLSIISGEKHLRMDKRPPAVRKSHVPTSIGLPSQVRVGV